MLARLIGIANYFENIGDVISKDMLAILHKRQSLSLVVSDSTQAMLEPIEHEVGRAYEKMLAAFESGNVGDAMDAIESKTAVTDLAAEASAHLARRLVADAPSRIEAFEAETDIIENLRRLNTYTRRIARLIIAHHNGEESAAAA